MEFGHWSDKGLPDMLKNVPRDRELYKINSYGYRCQEWTPMPDGKKNVVVLGCSHTFGQGLAEDEHWVHFLSQHNTNRLRYWNLGQPGASGDRIVRTLYGSEKLIDPRVVIVCWPDWSRREKYNIGSTANLAGGDETLRYETEHTDLNNFLRNVFLVEKYAERMNCLTFHCFAQETYDEHLQGPYVLREQTIMNCWPWWDKVKQREAQSNSVARDGQHYGIKHHQRFAELFLHNFGLKLK
tara:strand:- start:1154 stop:1873 length:720 start_codon:yes stop_codon:yes gene_type:complete